MNSASLDPSQFRPVARHYATKLGCNPSDTSFDDIVSEAMWRMTKLVTEHPDAALYLYYVAAKRGAIDGMRRSLGKVTETSPGNVVFRRPRYMGDPHAAMTVLHWVPSDQRPDAVRTMKALLKIYPPTSLDGGIAVGQILLDIAGGMTRQAAADKAGLTPGRVSQIVASYVERVRRTNPTICRATHAYDLDHDSIEVLMTEPWS